MTDLTQVKDGMTSQEIAEVTGKRHADIMRNIRNLLEQGVRERNFALTFKITKLPNGAERKDPYYNLTPKGVLILASGYNALLREKIINRLEELEMEKRKAALSASVSASQPEIVPMERGHECEYIVFRYNGARVVSSRTLAMMCGRNHSDMMRSIRNAYRLLDRPRRSFIEMREGERTKEILVTVKGFQALRQICTSMPSDVSTKVSIAFARAHKGIGIPIPFFSESLPEPSVLQVPSMPSDPSELLARFTKAMAVMLGVDPDNLSGLMQKGGEL